MIQIFGAVDGFSCFKYLAGAVSWESVFLLLIFPCVVVYTDELIVFSEQVKVHLLRCLWKLVLNPFEILPLLLFVENLLEAKRETASCF